MKEFFNDVKVSFKQSWKEVPRLYFLPFTAIYDAYKKELNKS